MKKEDINIRDPFVLVKDGKYYLYGTRGAGFGIHTGGFDVYVSEDLVHFSDPIECFHSKAHGLDREVNWAPEVHEYRGKYYMLATFTQENGLRGTYSLVSDSPLGPFLPHSHGALTPSEWECLDGTLHVDGDGTPYLVFCHEHTQIVDGTVCYARLSESLDRVEGEVTTLFSASECPYVDRHESGHFVTDGPFLYRSSTGELLMIWSSFIKGNYAELLVRFQNGRLGMDFEHLPPILDSDGGHGMLFSVEGELCFTYHTPNASLLERPAFCRAEDLGDRIAITPNERPNT